MSLPIPAIDHLPRIFRDDPKATSLSNMMDSHIILWRDETLGLDELLDPIRCPGVLLDVFGEYVNAGILGSDSEDTKRKKIATAIQGHKLAGTWIHDIKPKIDVIAGGDSTIVKATPDSADWIILGDGNAPATYYWSSLGADGIDDFLGIDLYGDGYEVGVQGNIYINVDNAALTAEEQADIVILFEIYGPAYFYIHIGYLSGGNWVEYIRI